ncbi:cytochrome P450 [Kitasatospora sp. MAP12-15]|uniref:cytochrome P450 n=1 Tax=unclassified Kitasatospora TaxID=2633591 RepID=UPI0024741527|nr:cytochrome P450 [Kitasatospora sp. MAP12-44]MDH6113679.1 cytochrome P450 [Kitasatospora sp. MAP12-44]
MTDTAPIETSFPTFPMARKCPYSPPAEYAGLRETEPVSKVTLPTGATAWVVANHTLVRQILADPRVSSDRTLPGCPRLIQVPPQALRPSSTPLIALDPPEHTTHRRMVTNEFTLKRIQGMRPRIQELVDARIDEMLQSGGSADLVPALAVPVPAMVICELLGVDYEERDTFTRISEVLVRQGSTPPEIGAAMGEIRAFLAKLVADKEKAPEQDLISRLIVKYKESGTYDAERVISTAMVLLNAGHETTTSMIALGAVALLEHPEQLAEIQADPSLVPQAVEELLRYFSIADLVTFRTATEDIALGDVVIKAGEGLIALGAAANHDPQQFPNADILDIHRNARQHVAFGYGVHQCIGQNLARLELEIVFTTLFSRLPGLKLATPVTELPYKHQGLLFGIHSVPVTW